MVSAFILHDWRLKLLGLCNWTGDSYLKLPYSSYMPASVLKSTLTIFESPPLVPDSQSQQKPNVLKRRRHIELQLYLAR